LNFSWKALPDCEMSNSWKSLLKLNIVCRECNAFDGAIQDVSKSRYGNKRKAEHIEHGIFVSNNGSLQGY
jgi:hypothetical protein